ncbi:hypothetical protein T440DRAFT_470864 [Plenodomus tracheiphilus IPT5]|uniref:SWI5-dependent HO expression protein 3 n=1 Tax=Plenodomus tracheiphilus IPT5 TaxID=1408161 RepID=A0A6A7AXM3_9PLEO|nr:hypothetical protein T440DRAFT_470864 [Plenodomus tracheiphilus IPT5]
MNGSIWTADSSSHTTPQPTAATPTATATATSTSTSTSLRPTLTSTTTSTSATTTMPSYSSPRTTFPLAVESPNMSTTDPSTAPTNPPTSTTTASWDRPNPHSIPNSKTSQYIDKITSENDRLRRELHAEKLLREDESKRVSAARSAAEDSRAEFQHLQVLADTNGRAIERKDRKLEELKTTLEAEVKRRRSAEQRAEEALKMLGDTRSETQRQLSQAYEMKGMAETYLETAREGFRRIVEGYEKKVRSINEELNELRRQRLEDADKIKRQAVVVEQLHHEMGRSARAEGKLGDLMKAYKEEHRKDIEALLQEAERMRNALPDKEREAEDLVQSLVQVRDKMRWVVTQSERQKEQESQQENRGQEGQGQEQRLPLHSRQQSSSQTQSSGPRPQKKKQMNP